MCEQVAKEDDVIVPVGLLLPELQLRQQASILDSVAHLLKSERVRKHPSLT